MATKPIRVSPKPRNHLALHPLMRKGARHEKSRKAQRQAAKIAVRTEVNAAIT